MGSWVLVPCFHHRQPGCLPPPHHQHHGGSQWTVPLSPPLHSSSSPPPPPPPRHCLHHHCPESYCQTSDLDRKKPLLRQTKHEPSTITSNWATKSTHSWCLHGLILVGAIKKKWEGRKHRGEKKNFVPNNGAIGRSEIISLPE